MEPSAEASQTKLFFSVHRLSISALGFLPARYRSLKPEIPATSTLVSITMRGMRFLTLGDNSNLRHPPLFAKIANGAQDFFFRDFAEILCCVIQRLKKFLLPSPALPPAGQIPIECGATYAFFNLLSHSTEWHGKLDGGLFS